MIMPMPLFSLCMSWLFILCTTFIPSALYDSAVSFVFFLPFFSSADFRLKFNGFQAFTNLKIMRVGVDVALATCQYF